MQLTELNSSYSKKNLSYIVAEKLGKQILSGHYEQESLLPGEIELAETLSVSRTVIREAIKMLTSKGMLLPRPRIGTRITPMQHWNLLDNDLLTWWIDSGEFSKVSDYFYHVRLAIEPQACYLAAFNATENQKQSLLLFTDKMQQLDQSFDRQQWLDIDTQFHYLIYQASGNPFFASFGSLFLSAYKKYFDIIVGNETVQPITHRQIVQAIIDADGNKARNLCLTLLTND
ncbi:FadR/GntR family transcriptional regulator [Proteus myxofaciens]|uniref:GntR family transcriptional regulator n=1 Tax=Proteus myxofaciens ATCC 19692 TaxID=1354337 RepID=A0A198FXE3_9GAMM|nr:FadR/GntR family transcriptional regulator [Proteus myxofaciens]OAT29518.1 GntR family transcriptional regulator [Proteus myxofaciens ATCC 19692]